MTPSKVARTVARAAAVVAAARDASAWPTAASASATMRSASSTSLRAAMPRSNSSALTCLIGLRRPERGLRPLHFSRLTLHFGRQRRNLEADEDVSPGHALTLGAPDLEDAACFGRNDDQLAFGRGIDDARGVEHSADRSERRFFDFDGYRRLAFGLFGSLLAARCRCYRNGKNYQFPSANFQGRLRPSGSWELEIGS